MLGRISDDYARIQEIDTQMVATRSAWLALASERNRLASLSCRIPSEILARILIEYKNMFLVPQDPEGPYPGGLKPVEYGLSVPWIRPSHVCSHWREVALSTAHLWDCVHLNSVEWTEELLRRSRGADLHVLGGFSHDARNVNRTTAKVYQKSLTLCLSHIGRIQTLDIGRLVSCRSRRGLIVPSDALIGALTDADSSHIRSFALDFTTDPNFDGQDNWESLTTFFYKTTRLAHLTLASLSIASLGNPNLIWTDLHYPNLTHLRMLQRDAVVSTKELLRLASRLPWLQSLDFGQQCFTSDVDAVVQLPHLSSLSLDTNIPALVQIIEHIDIPRTAKIKLIDPMSIVPVASVDDRQTLADLGTAVRPYLTRHSSGSPPEEQQIRSIALEISRRRFSMASSTDRVLRRAGAMTGEPLCIDPWRPLENPSLELDITRASSEEPSEALLSYFLPFLPHVEQIALSFALNFGDDAKLLRSWLGYFHQLDAVRVLEVNLDAEYLSLILEALSYNAPKGFLFPSLEKIIFFSNGLFDSSFIPDNNPTPSLSSQPSTFTMPSDIVDMFRNRRQAGCGIAHCEIFGLKGSEIHELIDDLHDVVDTATPLFMTSRGLNRGVMEDSDSNSEDW